MKMKIPNIYPFCHLNSDCNQKKKTGKIIFNYLLLFKKFGLTFSKEFTPEI
jgi:hypothetical protein